MSAIVCKADPIGNQVIPSQTIGISLSLPESTGKSNRELTEFFKGEAGKIADALFTSLPGATLDQLVIEMLERKACMLHVKY